jgi:hypothetical protein
MVDPVLTELDNRQRTATAVDVLRPIVATLVDRLRQRPDAIQAWEPINAADLGFELPAGVVSTWLFVLRPGATFPSERHPNSWQRSLALQGRATFELYAGGVWVPHVLDGTVRVGCGQRIVERAPPELRKELVGFASKDRCRTWKCLMRLVCAARHRARPS